MPVELGRHANIVPPTPSDGYFAPPAGAARCHPPRHRPAADAASALGTSLTGSGFANPYPAGGGITPLPATTASGYDWCNPEPNQFTPSPLGITPTLPTAVKGCPLPVATALGGQSNGARENAPVNRSYGLQLALAWNGPAPLSTRIPAASGDVSG